MYKKHTNSHPANYDPIRLFSISIKVIEAVIVNACKRRSNLLIDVHFGVHWVCSALELIAALVQALTKKLNSRTKVKVTRYAIK